MRTDSIPQAKSIVPGHGILIDSHWPCQDGGHVQAVYNSLYHVQSNKFCVGKHGKFIDTGAAIAAPPLSLETDDFFNDRFFNFFFFMIICI